MPSQPPLIPELHGEADDLVPLARSMAATVEESDPSRHGDGDGFVGHSVKLSSLHDHDCDRVRFRNRLGFGRRFTITQHWGGLV